MTTLSIRNSVDLAPVYPPCAGPRAARSIKTLPFRRGLLLIPLVYVCFTLSQQAQAVCQDACLNNDNTVLGSDALINLTIGSYNTAIGFSALSSNTTGNDNTTAGAFALVLNTSGNDNTADGAFALQRNTTGSENTAIGSETLYSNTTGGDNTATGFAALYSNTTGISNTANGWQALYFNTTGNNNTATGLDALLSNTIGFSNTATGVLALGFNTTGNLNTASGAGALVSNTIGANNTAVGGAALQGNTTGDSNTALGVSAGANLTTGSNNIDIGNAGVAGESRTIRVGTMPTHKNTFIAGIFNAAVTGSTVVVNSNGKLGVTASSARFKDAIKPMDKASEAILALKPVTFRYKHDIDPANIPQFGLVAEQVERVNPDLVARDEQGKPYTVRYEAVNAMLLNEFLKEHRKVQQLEANAVRQQKQIEALTAGLQEVKAQVGTSHLTAQTVVSNP